MRDEDLAEQDETSDAELDLDEEAYLDECDRRIDAYEDDGEPLVRPRRETP